MTTLLRIGGATFVIIGLMWIIFPKEIDEMHRGWLQ